MNKTTRINTPIYMLVSGGVLLIIVASILISQNSGGVVTKKPTTLADSHEDETYPEIPRISIEEAKAALDEGTVVLLDVRDADLYATSHLPGALNIPLAELQSRLEELDIAIWIITYCT